MSTRYDRHLPLKDAYPFGGSKGLRDQIDTIRKARIRGDRASSTRRGLIIKLFQQHGVFQEFKDAHWQDGSDTRYQKLVERHEALKTV